MVDLITTAERTHAHAAQPEERFDSLQAAQSLAAALHTTAVERDRAGGHANAERERIRASGLLRLTIPTRFGGLGRGWGEFYRTLRTIATADSALAHVYAFHHLQIASVLLYGTEAQQQFLLEPTAAQSLFWGNALNPNDHRAVATSYGDDFVVDGPKSYCSGSVGADWLTFSAWHDTQGGLLIGVVPAHRAGLRIDSDWNAFGQRQTDSGTVTFDAVRVEANEVLVAPGAMLTARATLRSQLAQLILVQLYAGIAEGALAAGIRHTRERSRPFFGANVLRAVDDPYVQQRYGQLRASLSAAQVMTDRAAQQIDQAWDIGEALSTAQRGEVAISVAEAKVIAHDAVMNISSQIFELTGPSGTHRDLGLDRFWRNARVHTLHDSIDYKRRDLGRHLLTDRWPEPTSYS